jgi:hypothetical protein
MGSLAELDTDSWQAAAAKISVRGIRGTWYNPEWCANGVNSEKRTKRNKRERTLFKSAYYPALPESCQEILTSILLNRCYTLITYNWT